MIPHGFLDRVGHLTTVSLAISEIPSFSGHQKSETVSGLVPRDHGGQLHFAVVSSPAVVEYNRRRRGFELGVFGRWENRHAHMDEPRDDVTQLLLGVSGGDVDAQDQLMSLVYEQLRSMARGHMNRERVDHTLQSTALVHEAYLQLIDQTRVVWQDRAHFYAVASIAMRRALVRSAERKNAKKRGGDHSRVALNDHLKQGVDPGVDLLALDEALRSLAAREPRLCRVVEMRYFGGMSNEQIAEVLGVNERTVQRDWQLAKVFLLREMSDD